MRAFNGRHLTGKVVGIANMLFNFIFGRSYCVSEYRFATPGGRFPRSIFSSKNDAAPREASLLTLLAC
jgi:hypothetical protein